MNAVSKKTVRITGEEKADRRAERRARHEARELEAREHMADAMEEYREYLEGEKQFKVELSRPASAAMIDVVVDEFEKHLEGLSDEEQEELIARVPQWLWDGYVRKYVEVL